MQGRVVAIIQARMGSTRLPGKVMKKVLGKPLLTYLIERIKRAQLIDDFVVATSVLQVDDVIEEYCIEHNINCYRGSEADVLLRYFDAAIWSHADYIVRVCADSPLIDPEVIDELVKIFFSELNCDYASNTISQTYPLGMNAEIFSFAALQKAHLGGALDYEREHVTPYIYNHPDRFKILPIHLKENFSGIRLTVDYEEDFELVKSVIEHFYPINQSFGLDEILDFLNKNSYLLRLNANLVQKSIC